MTASGSMQGRTCLISGVNSGIGKEAAVGLAKLSAKVVLVSRNFERGEAALVLGAAWHATRRLR